MKKLLFYVCLGFSLCLLSCTSKEEKERQRIEKARIEREAYVQDSIRAENERNVKEQQRLKELREDSIRTAKRLETIKNSVKITSYYLTSPNSASGVDAYFYYKNLSDKPIKYLVWEGYPINAVGDMVSCTIRDYSNYRGKDTGPVKKGSSGGGCWSCAWYNWEAKKLILTGVDIEYMDGSKLLIREDELYLIGKKKNK